MPPIRGRQPYGILNPYRPKRPASGKIIFLSMEGSVTEEQYVDWIRFAFEGVRTKIQLISVAEDAVQTISKFRTPDQKAMLSKVRPLQLVERMDKFVAEKEEQYQLSEYDDEFWIVSDVDKNWSNDFLPSGKTYLDEWNEAVAKCEEKNYGYAISNPFFEVWLLLHHDEPDDIDKSFGVTYDHQYQKTNHFRLRLRELGAPLKDTKGIRTDDYTVEKVKIAIARAKALHQDPNDLYPHYFATTVYRLLDRIMELLPEETSEQGALMEPV